jgi:hypothetical protein
MEVPVTTGLAHYVGYVRRTPGSDVTLEVASAAAAAAMAERYNVTMTNITVEDGLFITRYVGEPSRISRMVNDFYN